MKLLIDNKEIIEVRLATSTFSRMKGLMGKKNIDFALFFNHCNNIHTFFMKEPIDVLYIDKNSMIVYIDKPINPWKIGKIIKKSKSIIELPQGTVKKYNINIGQKVNFKE